MELAILIGVFVVLGFIVVKFVKNKDKGGSGGGIKEDKGSLNNNEKVT